MAKKMKLRENPDRVKSVKGGSGMSLDWADDDAVVFGYYDNEMVMSVPDKLRDETGVDGHIANHTKLLRYNTTGKDLTPPGAHWMSDRSDFEFPGRLWYKHKLISFWRYPSTSKLISMISAINKLAKGKFKIDDTWSIEVILDEKGLAKVAADKAGGRLYGAHKGDFDIEYSPNGDAWTNSNVKVIPIADYFGSLDSSKADQAKHHIASPLVKKQKVVPPGVGSKKALPGQGTKELAAQWRARHQQERKLKLKPLLKCKRG